MRRASGDRSDARSRSKQRKQREAPVVVQLLLCVPVVGNDGARCHGRREERLPGRLRGGAAAAAADTLTECRHSFLFSRAAPSLAELKIASIIHRTSDAIKVRF
ncbi:unnamed protein product [Lota lota]